MTKRKELRRTRPNDYRPGFLTLIDGRTQVGHILKRRYDGICRDLGGETHLSHFQRSLAERAVFLEDALRDMEYQLATARQAGPEDKEAAKHASEIIGRWVQASNAYLGICVKLGLKKHKVTVDLKDHLAKNYGNAEEDGDVVVVNGNGKSSKGK